MTINQKNLLPVVQNYFASLNLEHEAADFFTSKRFDSAVVLRLPDVCLLPKNKPAHSKSKQTHIHVTGDSRYAFFSKEQVDGASQIESDYCQKIIVSNSNILHLRERTATMFASLDLQETDTMTKVAFRQNGESQVQISKIRMDGLKFIALRTGLFSQDLLIFLKYRGEDKFFAMGIPLQFYKDKYDFPKSGYFKCLESPNTVTLTNALSDIATSTAIGEVISSSDNIEDLIYQQLVDEADSELELEENYTAEKYIDSNDPKAVTSNRPNTNPRLGKAVIKHNAYRCAFDTEDQSHKTFQKPDGTLYMEVHHLIPLEQQSHFENKLDTKANLVPVCPLCHRLLHYGRKVEIEKLLTELYDERQELLKQSGLDITLDELKSYY